MSTDDIVPFLVPEPSPGVRYGQGKVIGWDPDTFANRILWRDVVLEDLPVVAGTTGLTVVPGDDVVLLGSDSGGEHGITQWWVQGPLVEPGSTAAERQVDFLRGSLAKQISAQVFGERVFIDAVVTGVTLSGDDTFGDLAGSPGPEVTCEVVTGTALAFVGTRIEGTVSAGIDSVGGYAGVEVSGATTIEASTTTSAAVAFTNATTGGQAHATTGRFANVIPFTGLNPGEHTFTVKYRNFTSSADCLFSARTLAVIAL